MNITVVNWGEEGWRKRNSKSDDDYIYGLSCHSMFPLIVFICAIFAAIKRRFEKFITNKRAPRHHTHTGDRQKFRKQPFTSYHIKKHMLTTYYIYSMFNKYLFMRIYIGWEFRHLEILYDFRSVEYIEQAFTIEVICNRLTFRCFFELFIFDIRYFQMAVINRVITDILPA